MRSYWRRWSSVARWSPSAASWPTSVTGSPIRGSVFTDRVRDLGVAYRDMSRGARAALIVLALLYLAALLSPIIAPYEPWRQLDIVALKNHSPSLAHPFGTDRFSRDLLSRV